MSRGVGSQGDHGVSCMDRRGFLVFLALGFVPACRRAGIDDGIVYGVWGSNGLRDGHFIRPRAIGANQSEVFVIDTTGRVQVFTENGEFSRSWSLPASEKGTPTGIGFCGNGNLLIPDTHYSRVLEYTPRGEPVSSWGSYGTGEDRFVYPTGIARAANGLTYISEYGMAAEQVRVFDQDRRTVRQWGGHGQAPGQFNRAMAIAFSETGGVYVADTANHRVQRFDTEGRLLAVIGTPGTGPGQLNFPHDLAIAPDGTLFVAEYGAHRVSRFSGDGRFMTSYGGPGREPGRFNGPRGIAVSASGVVFVADTDNHRIQRFGYGRAA